MQTNEKDEATRILEEVAAMNELKPCPFCGKNKAEIHYPYFTDTYCCVQCYECYCTTGLFKTPEEAAKAWNRRAEDD